MALTRKPTTLAQLEKLIDTSVEEDFPRNPRYKTHGRRSKMGVCGFLFALYSLNEQLAIRGGQNPMTNASIEREFRKEFSHSPEALKSWDKGHASVNSYRHKYNKGLLMESFPKPEFLSLRYDKHGNPVDSRTGTHKLLPAELRDLCLKYGIPDTRFCDQNTIREIQMGGTHV